MVLCISLIIQCCSETSWSESLFAVLCSFLSQWLWISLSLSLSILSVQGLACSSPLLLAAAGLTIDILSLPHVWMCHYCWKSCELLLTGDSTQEEGDNEIGLLKLR